MRKWLVAVILFVVLLLFVGIGAISYFVIYGVPSVGTDLLPISSSGSDRLERAVKKWRKGEFDGYDRVFVNPERFEEVLFLNFVRGRLTLGCEVEDGNLLCNGFSPIRVKRRGSKYEIVSTSIYLVDSTGSLGKRRKSLADWISKLKNTDYYGALEICVGQIRDRSPTDSLYLEMKALERDTVVLSRLKDKELNFRFYEIFEDRMVEGHICLPFEEIWNAHRRFDSYVDAQKGKVSRIKTHLVRKRGELKEVVRKLEETLEKLHDPLALAFYKRGLQYYSEGDLESARIFFRKALKIEPEFEQARKSLERVEALIESGR